jgi:glycosyltransferase involved in cell wall biosynthesis
VEIAGTGPHIHELKQLERKGIAEVHGFITGEELDEFYRGGGVLLFLSETEENFPMTILEALSFGIPVVAVNRGGVSELVVDGKNGYLTSSDPEVIVSRVLRILDDRKLRESMRNRAREYANTFNWNRVIKAYLQLYDTILNV